MYQASHKTGFYRMATPAMVEILECPVCLSVPGSTPIYQCTANGHVICNICIRSLGVTCPVCRSQAGFGRCLTAERLFDEYFKGTSTSSSPSKPNQATNGGPRRRCDHHGRGCQEFKSQAHQLACRYRTVKCPEINCHKEVVLNSLTSDHLVNAHPDVKVRAGNATWWFRLCIGANQMSISTAYRPAWFVQNGLNFFREVKKVEEDKAWYFWVYFDGTEYQASTIGATIELLNDKKEPIVTFRDNVVPLDVSFKQVLTEFRCLSVPNEIMKRKIVKNEEFLLHISLTFGSN